MMKFFRAVLVISLFALLSACGGGGGSAGSTSGVALFSTAADRVTILPGESQTYNIGGGIPGYSATSSTSAATVTVSGKVLTINGSGSGKSTVTITDNAGGKISIDVTIGTGTDFFSTAPDKLTIGIGSTSSNFEAGGGSGVYAVSSSNKDVLRVTQNGKQFFFTGLKAGTSTVTVSDNAGGKKSIEVTVGSGVDLYTTAPDSLTIGVGVTSSNFTIGGGSESYTVTSSNPEVATVAQVGKSFTVKGVSSGSVDIVIMDTFGAIKRVNVTVGSSQALFTTAPSKLMMGVGATSTNFEIGGGSGVYLLTSSNIDVLRVTQNGKQFFFTGLKVGASTVTVSDSAGEKKTVEVTVGSGVDLFTSAPDALIVGVGATSASFTIGGGSESYIVTSSNLEVASVTLSGNSFIVKGLSSGSVIIVITDTFGATKRVNVTVGSSQALFTTAPSTLTVSVGASTQSFVAGGGSLAYTLTSSNSLVASVIQVGSTFVISGVSPGTTSIVITDTLGASKSVSVTVGTSQPLFTTAPVNLDLGIGLTSASYDIGGGEPAYVINTSNSLIATVSYSLNKFTISGVGAGKAIVTITDKFGQKNSINVTVSTGSDLYITAPSAVNIGIGLESSTFAIGGGSKVYTVTSGNSSVVTVAQNGNQFVLKGLSLGATKVTVTDSLGALKSIDVSVVNGLQLYTTAPSALTVGVGVNSATYSISGGSPIYSVATSNSAVVSVTQIGSQFFLTGKITGKATVLITDSVGGNKSIDVTVTTGSDLFTNAGADVSVGVGVTTSNFQIGGGSLVYSVSTANAQIATISIQTNTFTITGIAVGKTSVFVTDSLGATKKIDVTVGSPLDLYVTSPLDLTIGLGITSPTYQIGGGTAPYAVASSNGQVFTVTLTGAQFTVTGVSAGKATLIVTDAKGATKQINVTVGSGIDLYTTAPATVIVAVNSSSATYKIGGGSEVYTVSSSDSKIVTIGQNTNKEFVITGTNGGKAVVSVKDSVGKEVKIDVIVGTLDAMFSTAASNINLDVGGATTYKVGGGTGVYSVGSSNTAVAQATISGSDLVINGVGSGTATVVVRDSTTGSVTINVNVGSATPIALFVTAGADIIVAPSASPTFVIGGGKAPYAVTSSNPSVVTASVSGTTLTLNGVVAGNSKINVTDMSGTSVSINVSVTAGNAVALFATAPSQITIGKDVSATYVIGGGVSPYTVTSSNTAMATATLSGSSFTILGVSAGDLQIVIQDSLGATVTRSVTVTPVAVTALDILPGNATGAVGDVLTFKLVGGTPSFTITNNNPSIATVTPVTLGAGGVFTATLLNVGSTDVTVLDAQGTSKKVTITATASASSLRISPSALTISEDSTNTFDLKIYGGTGPYRAFTSDLVYTSVPVGDIVQTANGTILTIGLGSQGTRCVVVKDSSGTVILGGAFAVTLTVIDSKGASATSALSIKDNFKGGVGCL